MPVVVAVATVMPVVVAVATVMPVVVVGVMAVVVVGGLVVPAALTHRRTGIPHHGP
jgi:hypothetical protein